MQLSRSVLLPICLIGASILQSCGGASTSDTSDLRSTTYAATLNQGFTGSRVTMRIAVDNAGRLSGTGVLYWPEETPKDVKVTGYLFDGNRKIFLSYSSILQGIKSQPLDATVTISEAGFTASDAGAPEAISTLVATKEL